MFYGPLSPGRKNIAVAVIVLVSIRSLRASPNRLRLADVCSIFNRKSRLKETRTEMVAKYKTPRAGANCMELYYSYLLLKNFTSKIYDVYPPFDVGIFPITRTVRELRFVGHFKVNVRAQSFRSFGLSTFDF